MKSKKNPRKNIIKDKLEEFPTITLHVKLNEAEKQYFKGLREWEEKSKKDDFLIGRVSQLF